MEKRSQLNIELDNIKAQPAKTPKLPLEELIERAKKLLGTLDLTDKRIMVRELVTKVVATQKEAIIWGRIPIFAAENTENHNNHQNSVFATHLLNERKVGLYAQYRYRWVAECWEVDAV